jgi:DNA-binding NtrC family response regulator
VVEDEDNVRGLISKLLDRRGYKVLEARNAGEALLLCERHKEKIHLLITDVVLPIMRGDELAGRLKNIRPDIKFLFISGYIERKIEHEDIDPSEINFIQKPFEIEPFISKIREILDS